MATNVWKELIAFNFRIKQSCWAHESAAFLRNLSNCLPVDTAYTFQKTWTSKTPLWKRHTLRFCPGFWNAFTFILGSVIDYHIQKYFDFLGLSVRIPWCQVQLHFIDVILVLLSTYSINSLTKFDSKIQRHENFSKFLIEIFYKDIELIMLEFSIFINSWHCRRSVWCTAFIV